MLIDLTGITLLNSLIWEHKLVLLDFYADWCEPCKWLETILEEVDSATEKELMMIKIDIENYPELAALYNIRSVPVVCIINRQKLIWRINGFVTAQEFVKKINSISRETKS